MTGLTEPWAGLRDEAPKAGQRGAATALGRRNAFQGLELWTSGRRSWQEEEPLAEKWLKTTGELGAGSRAVG